MGNMSVEQKLEMIRRVRESSTSNSTTLRGRQRILSPTSNIEEKATGKISFFKLKIFIAIVLFVGFLILDMTDINFFNIKAETIINTITRSLEIEKLSFFHLFGV